MNLFEKVKESLTNEKLFEAIHKIFDQQGHLIATCYDDESLKEFEDSRREDDDYIVQTIENKPKTKQQPKKELKPEVNKEISDFLDRYAKFKEFYEKRIEFVQNEEPSAYTEMLAEKRTTLRRFWYQELKRLSPEAQKIIKDLMKKKRAMKKLSEDYEPDKSFYTNLLEASFNPNVKSSWITQIWYEPNMEDEEDEEGNILGTNPKDPNAKGTVFMRVKNSKSGKVYPTYEFPDVPRKVYIMWRRARSKGKYFWRRMKYNYGI